MRLLLDTHALLWFALGDSQLSAKARNQLGARPVVGERLSRRGLGIGLGPPAGNRFAGRSGFTAAAPRSPFDTPRGNALLRRPARFYRRTPGHGPAAVRGVAARAGADFRTSRARVRRVDSPVGD